MTELKAQSPSDRRIYTRYQMPISNLVEARWNGKVLPLAHDPQHENISALGLRVALERGPAPPVGAKLDIRFPLVEKPTRPGRAYAQCSGRVVRHDRPNLVAVYLQDVNFVADDAAGPNGRALVRG
ncbi:MAG: hypothetical protein L0212_03515 [Acidobacteria bacterium]|nr:hypothetical protein [Acidobacteriota bacterium]